MDQASLIESYADPFLYRSSRLWPWRSISGLCFSEWYGSLTNGGNVPFHSLCADSRSLLFIYQCRYPTDHPLRPQRTSERKIRHLNSIYTLTYMSRLETQGLAFCGRMLSPSQNRLDQRKIWIALGCDTDVWFYSYTSDSEGREVWTASLNPGSVTFLAPRYPWPVDRGPLSVGYSE